MTNFFTQLAARTLGLTPIVQPRIDSVFVPEVFVSEVGSEAIESTAPTESTPAAIEPFPIAAAPLVNLDRPTLPIAHAPRSIAPAIVPSRDQAVLEVRSSPDVSPAGDRSVPETNPEINPVTVDRAITVDRAVPPPKLQEFPPSALPAMEILPSAATSDPIATEKAASTRLPFAIEPSAIEPNQRLARSEVEPRSIGRLSSSDAIDSADVLPSPNRVDAARVSEQAVQTVSQIERISVDRLVDREVQREQATLTPQSPAIQPIDRTEPQPPSTLLPVPRQTAARLPIVTPRLERSPARLEAAPPATPTIQVTIGRIEVRAVAPPAPTRPRVATPPARLSLEDYLRSRSGGER